MKKFIVFGLGISGNAAVKFLLEQGAEVVVGDDNQSSLESLNKYLQEHQDLKSNLKIIKNIQAIDWQNAQSLVLAAGIPLKYPTPHKIVLEANKNNCPIICDVEILYLFNKAAQFIGITGTNGKSTTTALSGHIFASAKKPHAVGGNIGIGALALPKLNAGENYIIEMSSYQLDLIDKTRFHIANILNITPDHLDRHKDMNGYIAAKKRIFLNQTKDDFAVIGIDNEHSKAVYEDLKNDSNYKSTLIPISTTQIIKGGIAMIGNIIYNNIGANKSAIDLGARTFLKGEHNAQNIAFAFANCFLSGISEEQIIAAIKTFQGLRHRMQLVKTINNINFINDSKATNADSTENALKPYQNIYWILGGKAKDGGIASLEQYFSKIKYAFLIGAASDEFAKTLENKVEYFKCDNLKNAFAMAYDLALKDQSAEKNILLSPACASFDQWKNFEVRGDFFIKLVEDLK
ncbi:MAG: UDP-N-acetylmuramoyl-L-alanine--D-glutamate ligase [Pseudomonadota bacterium]